MKERIVLEQAVSPVRTPQQYPGSDVDRASRRSHPVRGSVAVPGSGPAGSRAAPGAVITVAVMADDSITAQGMEACLRSRPDMCVVPVRSHAQAQVALILVRWVTDEALSWMQRFAQASRNEDPRFVLVGDGMREHQLLRAVTHGVVSVVPRQQADFERVVQEIRGVHEGRADLPDMAVGWLIKQIRAVRKDVLDPNGLTAAGLETREVEVLRLLADGLGTAQIATQLNYSERTVKNIIHGVLTRLKLRNRVQAVAFALRTGAI
jgi:DNA-binding NarL/FixJ family response regulator